MIKLRTAGVEAGFDVAQTFPPGQLGEGHTDELLPTGEVVDFLVAGVAMNTALELLGVDLIQELGQNKTTGMHDSRLAARTRTARTPSSNRSQLPRTQLTP
jgi:hypothetical protein